MIRKEAHKDKLISRLYRNEECEIWVDRQQRDYMGRERKIAMKETMKKSMVTVIMTIHSERHTKKAIIENERSGRVKRLKTLAQIHG